MTPKRKTSPRQISMLTYEQGQVLDVCGPLEVFDQANRFLETEAYDFQIVAERPGAVRMSSGISLLADQSFSAMSGGFDTLLVAGGDGVASACRNMAFVEALGRVSRGARRIASVCTGAFLLAEAGLLDHRRATTHWASCHRLARTYPLVRVHPDRIYVRDGGVYSSAGVTAGIDLALALVEEDHGRRIALQIAKTLVVFMKRPGGQSQFSAQLSAQLETQGVLEGLPEWIANNPREDLTVENLAQRVHMSPRNFVRVFTKALGLTPTKFVERVRIDHAATYLENHNLTMEQIAAQSGFATAERMRRSFQRRLGVLPRVYRERFGA
jgi:transcriptional regulator GlxA family with amidase domain